MAGFEGDEARRRDAFQSSDSVTGNTPAASLRLPFTEEPVLADSNAYSSI